MRAPSLRCGQWNISDACTAKSGFLLSPWCGRNFFLLPLPPKPQWRPWIGPDPPASAPFTIAPGRENRHKHVADALTKLYALPSRSSVVALSLALETSASHAPIPTVPLLQTSASSRDASTRTPGGGGLAETPSLLSVTRIAVVRLSILCHAVPSYSPTNADPQFTNFR